MRNLCPAHIIKMCARLWPYLTTRWALPAPPSNAPRVAQKGGNRSSYFAQFAQRKLRQRLTKCRDRHRRARPIICVPFWAVMSSFCVSISLFLSLPPFLLYRHRLWPVHKRADQVQGAHFGLKKSCPKMIKINFFGFFLFCLCLVYFCFLSFDDRNKGRKNGGKYKSVHI